MHDELDGLLAELARRAGGSVSVPEAGTTRRRGAQRAARRRMAGAAVALALVGGAVGTAEAAMVTRGVAHTPVTVVTGSSARQSVATSPSAPSTPSTSASGRPPSGSSTPASQPPESSAGTVPPFAALVGQWKPADGSGRYLVVYPDRQLGIGQAGGMGQPLCEGLVRSPSAGAYPINVTCSDYGTYGLSLSVDGDRLTLHVAADGGHPASTVVWVRAQPQRIVGNDGTATVPPWLVGTWALRGNPSYETFTVAAGGAVTWSLQNQQGQVMHGTATLEPLPDGTLRVHTADGTQGIDRFWQFAHATDGQLQVIGGYGPNAFDRETGGS